MNKNKLYEGKAKIIYETESIIQHFKDDATAFNILESKVKVF